MFFMSGLSEFIWPWFPPFFLQTSHTSPINCGINVWMSSDLNRFVIHLHYYVLFNIWEYTKQAMTLKWMTTPKPNSPSNGTASWNWRLITHSYITQRTSSRYQKFPGSRAWEIVGSIFRELKLVILHWIPLSFRELSFTPLKFCKPNTAKISINISCGFLRVFAFCCHRHDQTTITKTTGTATTTATTSQASALRYKCFPWRSLWNCGIKMNQTYSALFLVFGTLSADVQQTLRCLMVLNDMFSRPQRAGALEGVDPPWRKLFMKPDVNDVFHVWIVRVWFPPFFLQTSHTSPINCGINVWMSSDLNRFVIHLHYYVLFNIWEYTKQAMTLKWMTTPKPNSPSNGTASWNWRLITHSYITQRTSSRYQKFPGSRAWEIVGSIFRELKLVILQQSCFSQKVKWNSTYFQFCHYHSLPIPVSGFPCLVNELSFTPLKFCKPNTAKISINISCGFLRVFAFCCHRHDQTTITKTTGTATTTATTSQASALR